MEKKHKVLLVDDSITILTTVSYLLQDTEFEVVGKAKDGKEGVRLFRELRPDVVLLDYVMPDWNGEETLKRIVEVDPNVVVLMLTSYGVSSAIESCLQIGAKGFLQKPFQKEALLETIRNIVGED